MESNRLEHADSTLRGGILVLGNFDGVHRGHQAVMAAAREIGMKLQLPLRALTLEPHPRTLLSPAPQTPFRITPASLKNRLLQALGAEEVITLAFSPELAAMHPREFVEEILVRHYRARHIVAGAGFVFGYKRTGTMEDMRKWLEPHGAGVTEVALLRDERGDIVSSSRLRTAIHQGDWETARSLLGRNWSIAGVVTRGSERGRSLGFSTANMELGEIIRPPFGVYAIRAHRTGEAEKHEGIANIGVRPTFGGVHEILEFHLFNFNGHIYDQEWGVELLRFLRPERKFSGTEALREQIVQDVNACKQALKAFKEQPLE